MNTEELVYFLRGERVGLTILRPEADAPLCHRAMNDLAVTQFLERALPISYAAQMEWMHNANTKPEHNQIFGIALQENDEVIGVMSLHNINWVHRTAGTGAWIEKPEHWGKGYGTEAKLLLLRYAFRTLGLRKINSSVMAHNDRSRAYMEKTGYRVEGVREKEIRTHDGTYADLVLTAVFAEDFDALCEQNQQNLPDSVDSQ